MSDNFKNDDDFIIGKGFELSPDETTPKSLKKQNKKPKKKKKDSTVKSIIWVISIVVVSVGLAVGIIYAGADFTGIGFGRGDDTVMDIPIGTPASKIAEKLEESGAVKMPLLFRVYSKLMGYDSQFKYGLYTFNTESGYKAICEMLINDGAKADTVEVKIPEMATVDDIAALLSDACVCTKSDFIDAVQNGEFKFSFINDIPKEKVYYRLEGYLFPDTYSFYSYDSKKCAHLAVEKMLSNLENKLSDDMLEKINKSDYSFHELMTLASIVESESANGSAEERSMVAAVFYNRLEGINWDGPKFLQTDPSTYYPHGGGRYDTYKTEGLPPGPIGSPSLNSITATLEPKEDFTATYFVTDKNADFYFNDTLEDHNKIITKLKKEGLWLYTTLGSSK